MKSWVVFSKSSDPRWPPKHNVYTNIGPQLCTGLRYSIQFLFIIFQNLPQKHWSYSKLLKTTGKSRKQPKIAESRRKLPKAARNHPLTITKATFVSIRPCSNKVLHPTEMWWYCAFCCVQNISYVSYLIDLYLTFLRPTVCCDHNIVKMAKVSKIQNLW